MGKKYLFRRYTRGAIAALLLVGLIGFSASHAFVNIIDDDDNGDDRILVKIIKIEDGDTTIIEHEYDDVSEFHTLKHHLNAHDKAKGGVHFLARHYNSDEEDANIKIKVIDYGSDSGKSIHKKIIICSDEDTLEHKDIHINLQNMHREMAEVMKDLGIELSLDENWVLNLHKIMNDFEMDLDVHSEDIDENSELRIKSFHDNKKLKKMIEQFHAHGDAI
ncbi:MAG: hypothetical protein COB85_06165 [Bacteroidetes bacterium]|nr:MAG: hypothetical protein COB85_06165 [Bacteroidota bacterium]